VFATPIIMAKYFPNELNTLKNNKNLKLNNIKDIAISQWGGFLLINQKRDIITGKECAPTSIN
jgi:hypothetical protein